MPHLYDETKYAQKLLDKQDFKAKRQEILGDVDAIVTDMNAFIASPATTNAGRDAQLLVLTKAMKNIAKDLRVVTNAVKGLF